MTVITYTLTAEQMAGIFAQEEQLRTALAVLAEVEWGLELNGGDHCPSCQRFRGNATYPGGHARGCRLAKVLGRPTATPAAER